MAICEKCGVEHEGHWGTVRPLCLDCFAVSKGLTDPWKITAAYGRTGRPKGTTQYETRKVDENHHMTALAHAYIKNNKHLIEDMARKRFEVQWKMF